MKMLAVAFCLMTFFSQTQQNRQPVEVPLPDPVAIILGQDQPTIIVKRCEAWKQYESLVEKEKAGEQFSRDDIKFYSALVKALFTFSTISRPEAPNGARVSGDISGCVKSTGTVL